MTFREVCNVEDVPRGSSKIFKFDSVEIAIFNLGGEFFTVSNVCAHRGGQIGQGEIHQEEVSCPSHAWQFNIKTGNCLNVPGAKLKTYLTKLEKEKILVDL